jgi:methylthioribose-1-phosphate isomerase
MIQQDSIRAIEWQEDGLRLLDQRVLPRNEAWILIRDAAGVTDAIREMVVRGAPAIGITAAYGVVLAARSRYAESPGQWKELLEGDLQLLFAARPTAINLAWALDRMRSRARAVVGDPGQELAAEACAIHEEDIRVNRRMGTLGADVLGSGVSILTHCNTGSLATGGYGTALGVIRSAREAGKLQRVYADETRPWLQGARLTAWELERDGIPVTLLVDGAAASLMQQGQVQWVIVGADRIAGNGDVANKIGTYSLAVAARHHGVKFMVVAPTSTVDLSLDSGDCIPIECRPADEVLNLAGVPVAAEGADAWNPVFDVTPAGLIDVIVTERGVVEQPDPARMAAMMSSRPIGV